MKASVERYGVVVIGGGAAGMMAAIRAAECGQRVVLLEKNKRLGEKLSITGGGRCNITNAEEDTRTLLTHYGDAAPFLHSAFSQFGVAETFTFFKTLGLPCVVEARKRAFPETMSAPTVTMALVTRMKELGVIIRLSSPVSRIRAKGGRVTGVFVDTVEYVGDAYILATGGVSHPETGSTGDGFAWLRDIGHTVEKPTPTIVPLRARDAWVKELAGTTLKHVRITFFVERVRRFFVKGDVLLTHFGVSGPTILNSAGKVSDLLQEGSVTAIVDLFPEEDLGILDRRIAASFDIHKNKSLRNALRELVPPGTADVLLSLIPSIDPETKVHSVTKPMRRDLATMLKTLPLSIAGLMGLDRAVVADGGVPLEEIDTRTMRSRKLKNLFITGDLLHINRPTGGYSLQLCWTTGYVAGSHAH